MREFDTACLTLVRTPAPGEIRAIREREHLSQAVFARDLNGRNNLISDWERDVKKPGGPGPASANGVRKGRRSSRRALPASSEAGAGCRKAAPPVLHEAARNGRSYPDTKFELALPIILFSLLRA